MKGVLYSDSAVAGEAAGLGMGLLLAGTASDKVGPPFAVGKGRIVTVGVSVGEELRGRFATPSWLPST
jgi:hypothetical protein